MSFLNLRCVEVSDSWLSRWSSSTGCKLNDNLSLLHYWTFLAIFLRLMLTRQDQIGVTAFTNVVLPSICLISGHRSIHWSRCAAFLNLQEEFIFLFLAGNLFWQMGPEQFGRGLVKQDSPHWLGSHHRLGKELYHPHLTHHYHKYHQVDQLARISLVCPCFSSLWSRRRLSFCEFSTSVVLFLSWK